MRKTIKGLAAVLAVTALSAGTALAADKLVVKDTTGTNTVFAVEDNGNFSVPGSLKYDNTSKFLGIGTSSPQAVFHASYNTAFAPFILERELNNSGAVSLSAYNYAVTANNTSPAPLIGSGLIFASARGTKAAPADLVSGDRLGFLVFAGFGGGAQKNTAAINALVDVGTVSATSLPTYLQFQTTPNGSTTRVERLRIAGDGRLRISNQPAAPAANAPCTVGDLILDAPNGYLYLCTASGAWKRAAFTAY